MVSIWRARDGYCNARDCCSNSMFLICQEGKKIASYQRRRRTELWRLWPRAAPNLPLVDTAESTEVTESQGPSPVKKKAAVFSGSLSPWLWESLSYSLTGNSRAPLACPPQTQASTGHQANTLLSPASCTGWTRTESSEYGGWKYQYPDLGLGKHSVTSPMTSARVCNCLKKTKHHLEFLP